MDVPTPPSKVPGYDLYIDGFQALRRPKVLQGSNITHIVSALDWKFADNWATQRGFQHLQIPLDDVYDSNILSYFPKSNAFIHEALERGRSRQKGATHASSKDGPLTPLLGGVLVHCAMGVSRSTTIVLAYLLWHSRQEATLKALPRSNPSSSPSSTPEMVSLPPAPLTLDKALALIRTSRPQVEPNSGFIKQLRMYEAMNCPTTQHELESHKIYRRWMNSREVMDALSGNRAPEMEHISFRDEEDEDESDTTNEKHTLTDKVEALNLNNPEGDDPTEITNPDIILSSPSPAPPLPSNLEIKCRKCRRLLAKSTFILPHKPPPHRDPSTEGSEDPCAHIFLHPLSWMRPTLSQGGLDGRLTCPTPRCGANIGKFAWQGLRCSCGGWVTPGFGLAKGKVDEVQARSYAAASASEQGNNHSFAEAVRLPPGMRKGVNNGNL